jgi:uncharacterized glyoxalase superfamily protein PhnB
MNNQDEPHKPSLYYGVAPQNTLNIHADCHMMIAQMFFVLRIEEGVMTPRFDLIGLVAKDMAATLAFYRLLGLPIADGAESGGHVEVTVGGVRIAWDSESVVASFDESRSFVDGKGRIGLAFRCDTPAEVDSFYAKVTEAGYTGHKEPWDAFWGQRYAVVTDPDGNPIDLFADA